MKRATFLLAAALGLAASLTISAEVRAASTLVSVDVLLEPLPSTTKITGLTVTFTGAAPFTGLALESPSPIAGAAIMAAGETVTVSISSAVANAFHAFGAAFVDFNFSVPGIVNLSNPSVAISSATWLSDGSFAAPTSVTVSFSDPPSAAPEPTGVCLLGIGMFGLVTYRRFLNRVRSLS
jgi:hypothetical protein